MFTEMLPMIILLTLMSFYATPVEISAELLPNYVKPILQEDDSVILPLPAPVRAWPSDHYLKMSQGKSRI